MDAEHTFVLLGAILGSGGLFALIQFLLQKRGLDKLNKVQADKTAAEAWALLAEKLMAQIAQMQAIITGLRQQMEITETNRASLRQRIDELEAKIDEVEASRGILRQRVDDLEAEIVELRDWIIKQGLTPPPRKGKM